MNEPMVSRFPLGPTFSIFVRFRSKRLRLHKNLPTLEAAVRIANDLCQLRFHDPAGILIENDETKVPVRWHQAGLQSEPRRAPAAEAPAETRTIAEAVGKARSDELRRVFETARERSRRHAELSKARLEQLRTRLPAERVRFMEERFAALREASEALLASFEQTIVIVTSRERAA